MENEILPVASGLVAGVVLGSVTARRRPWVWALLSVLLGLLATILSGEFKTTWAFLLIDIPLVGTASAASFLVSRTLLLRHLRPV